MSLTLYFRATRKNPFSEFEKRRLEELVNKYKRKKDILQLVETGGGEPFSFRIDRRDSETALTGAVKLPLQLGEENLDDFIYVAESWIDLLSEMRNFLSDADWNVSLNDEAIVYNEEEKKFDIPI